MSLGLLVALFTVGLCRLCTWVFHMEVRELHCLRQGLGVGREAPCPEPSSPAVSLPRAPKVMGTLRLSLVLSTKALSAPGHPRVTSPF